MMFNGQIHYKWWFSITMLNYQRILQILYWTVLEKNLEPKFLAEIHFDMGMI